MKLPSKKACNVNKVSYDSQFLYLTFVFSFMILLCKSCIPYDPDPDKTVAPEIMTSLQCQNPTSFWKHRNINTKYIIFGQQTGFGDATVGLGDELDFFGAVYYTSAMTGREILIEDTSSVGYFCKSIKCNYPFASTIAGYDPIHDEKHWNIANGVYTVSKLVSFFEGTDVNADRAIDAKFLRVDCQGKSNFYI